MDQADNEEVQEDSADLLSVFERLSKIWEDEDDETFPSPWPWWF